MRHVVTKTFYNTGVEQAGWPTIESARIWAHKQDASKVEVYEDHKLIEEIIPSNPVKRDPGPLSP